MTAGGATLQSRLKRLLGVVTVAAMAGVAVAGCSGGGGGQGTVTLEFAQWWAPELPEGSFDKLISEFTSQNPKIKVKLLSAPYASTKQQLVSGAASRTLPDVVGLDGAWVNDFAKQGAITDLSALMSEAKYDPRSEEHTSELKSRGNLVCRLL